MVNIDTKEIMNDILQTGINKNASDIHIYPSSKDEKSIIKYRVKGVLIDYIELNNLVIESVVSLLKFNSNIDISLNKTPQSGRFEYLYNEKKYYLRVSTLPLNEMLEGCVIRIFTDEISKVEYSLFKKDSQKIKDLANNASGLIIFSGPTGSGKSTSMYKLAIDIAFNNKHVISIEDPIEKNIDQIIQMQVNEKAGINYNNALKSILRCDPDAIMVGEIRDSLTAKYVITSAYSGHLVLTTLHAENSLGVISRLLDLGVGKEDVKQTIICIVSQRLVTDFKGNRQLVTEILDKNDLKKYLQDNNTNFLSLKDKFDLAVKEGYISYEEKNKWKY